MKLLNFEPAEVILTHVATTMLTVMLLWKVDVKHFSSVALLF